jgi:class 3 adenylate cyclase
MVAGDAVNAAARIQSAAGPGQVLADLATQRLAESANCSTCSTPGRT